MKIKSITDVITNSSDETYIIKSNMDYSILEKELCNFRDNIHDYGSGMGGEITVYDNARKNKNCPYDENWYKWLEDNYLAIDIDYGCKKTIQYLKDHYEVVAEGDHEVCELELKVLEAKKEKALKKLEESKTEEEIQANYEEYEKINNQLEEL